MFLSLERNLAYHAPAENSPRMGSVRPRHNLIRSMRFGEFRFVFVADVLLQFSLRQYLLRVDKRGAWDLRRRRGDWEDVQV